MWLLRATLAALTLATFGCAGGSADMPVGPPIVGTTTTTDYVPFVTHTEKLMIGVVNYTAVGVDQLYVDWQTNEKDGNRAREEWSKDAQNVYLNAYSGTTNGQRYPIFSYRTEINGIEVPSPLAGQIYMPVTITGPTTVTVWGYINANNGSFGKYWAWRATFTPMLNVASPCGGARDALKQEEVWWDSDNGGHWLWNAGAAPPFDADHKPIPFTHTYVRQNYIGRGIGQAWILYENGKMLTCIAGGNTPPESK